MGRDVVRDSDDEGSQSSVASNPVFLAPPASTTSQTRERMDQLMQELQDGHAHLISQTTFNAQASVRAVDHFAKPATISPSGYAHSDRYAQESRLQNLPPAIPLATPEHQSFLENSSQKRKADADPSDEDEIALIPAPKRSRHEPTLIDSLTAAAFDRASMPPPGSQESINSQNFHALARSAASSVHIQPSPPRLRDNISFTTTGSTSFRGSRASSVQMFPLLDSVSFQQRLGEMEIDQRTEIESCIPSQPDETIIDPGRDVQSENRPTIGSRIQQAHRLLREEDSEDELAAMVHIRPIERDKENDPIIDNKHSDAIMVRVEIPQTRNSEVRPEDEETQVKSGPAWDQQAWISKTIEEPATDDAEIDAGPNLVKVGRKSKHERRRERQSAKTLGEEASISPEEQPREVVGETDPSTDGSMDPEPVKTHAKAINEATPAETTNLLIDKKNQAESASSESSPGRVEKREGLAPRQHSPISSGKVPMRVGLSKRAHIEPLLKVVRK